MSSVAFAALPFAKRKIGFVYKVRRSLLLFLNQREKSVARQSNEVVLDYSEGSWTIALPRAGNSRIARKGERKWCLKCKKSVEFSYDFLYFPDFNRRMA